MSDPGTDSTGRKLAANNRTTLGNKNRERKTVAKLQTTLDKYKFQVRNGDKYDKNHAQHTIEDDDQEREQSSVRRTGSSQETKSRC